MAITKSAKKAIRKSQTKRAHNDDRKNKMKKLLKEVKVLISQKKTDEAKKMIPQVYKALDKAAKAGVIKKNNASRKKALISKAVAKL